MKTWRRAVWCALIERDVEVEFSGRGVAGVRCPRTVKACTAFDPPTAVACGRRCIDSVFRRQWPSALPVHTRARKAVA